jgi:hypothetical protein
LVLTHIRSKPSTKKPSDEKLTQTRGIRQCTLPEQQ